MADQQHLFLSYSRQQFYFAESVVLSLQEAGLPMWFDVQELGPGEHWRTEIERGLAEARGLVLVASEASIASKYVRAEWEPMLAAGKPVYIIVFEPCILPPELLENAAAIIDLRGRFPRGIKRLTAAVHGEEVHRMRRVPRPNPLGVPVRLTGTVGFILVMVMLTMLVLLFVLYFGTLDAIQNFSAQSVVLLGVFILWAYYIGDSMLDLLRRKHTFRQMWIALVLSGPVTLLMSPGMVVFPLAALFVHFASAGTYRWLPTGEAPYWMRKRYGFANAPSLRQLEQILDATSTPQQQHYTISYAPEDATIAQKIEAALSAGGHQHVPQDDNGPGHQHILVLSEHTTVAQVERMVTGYAHALTPVVVGNVNARQAVDAIGEFQFVDYREQSYEQLEAVATFFRHMDAAKMIYGFHVLPLSSSTMRYPPAVRYFTGGLYLMYIFYLFATLFISGLLLSTLDEGLMPQAVLVAGLAVWCALVAVAHLRVVALVRRRSISMRGLVWRIGVLCLAGGLVLPQLILTAVLFERLRWWLPSEIYAKDAPTLPSTHRNAIRNQALRDSLIWGGLFTVLLAELVLQG